MKRKIISIVLGIIFIIVLAILIFNKRDITIEENYEYLKFTLINEKEYMVEGTIEEYAFLILDNATIYVPLESNPEGWANKWATNVKNVVYGYIEE